MIGEMELKLDDGQIKLGHRAGFGRCSGILPKFARRFVKGIKKLTGRTSKDRRKKTERLVARMPEAVGLAGVLSAIDPPRTGG
ncbi:hypothetical protein B296_00047661 [Ensete ventricosum]|uniref:Uncharacterized protein n=1 Tax=Ensete ventricosum TaxID=4639 RepID=A0A426Y1Z5_ENSVE|nr:hypothetical protein B296_00047661 [Ensete ventricosum]